MSEQANLASVEKIFSDLNARNLGSNDDLYAAGYQYQAPGAPGPLNLEQSRGYVEGFLTAFPDLHFELKTKVAQGDYVAVSWESTGTHTGPLRTPTGDTLPPTNKKVHGTGSSFYQFKNGKIVSSQIYWDMVTLLAQIGMMPGM
jgi:predicted ester cyclase